MTRFIHPGFILPIGLATLLASCAQGAEASLEPITPQTVAVHETLRISLRVRNAGDESLSFRFEGPELPGLDRAARISGGAGGGEFLWSPLSSHVGTHDFTFVLVGSDGSEQDRRSTSIEVVPQEDAAPVFMQPGAGGTYDLGRERCVSFDIQVRDEDTAAVEIRDRGTLPDGAEVRPEGPKRARFHWCPTPDQVTTSERWTIGLAADDGDHPPTELDYVAVLRSNAKQGCPGRPPSVTVLSPSPGERRSSEPGYTVRFDVSDDMGVRDAPLLYYTTRTPDDPADPDITRFEQIIAVPDGDQWRARIPWLGLDNGAETAVYVVASATDNDDHTGSLCDHHTESEMVRFVAVGASSGAGAPVCDLCATSTECASGVCVWTPTGGRCLDRCTTSPCSTGTCTERVTSEGALVRACGTYWDVCASDGAGGGEGRCTDDWREPNDSLAEATPAPASSSDGQICAFDDDYYRVTASAGTFVSVTVDGFVSSDGDLDLQLLDPAGAIVASSAGVSDNETASYCVADAGAIYARVFGYLGDENRYSMHVTQTPGSCCTDDPGEDDDTRVAARSVTLPYFGGTICPGDDDYLRFYVDGPSHVQVSIGFDSSVGDLDLELYGPSNTLVGSSRSVSDSETIDVDVTDAGEYVARVDGWRDASGSYSGQIDITATGGCTSTLDCPPGQVCDGWTCVTDECTTSGTCPIDHFCPAAGPGAPTSHCAMSCRIDSDCRSTEACKWFAEGSYCGWNGIGASGDGCWTFEDCGGKRTCLPWPNGYCARVWCGTNADCESGSYCVNVDGQNVCAKGCYYGDDLCRLSEGYICAVLGDTSGFGQWVCLPR